MGNERMFLPASTISSGEKDKILHSHLLVVLEENKKLNLTSIETIESGKILHIEDSLTGLSIINNALEGPIADIGSGAGYPGIPLAVYSGRMTFLIESIKKKASFLERLIESLGLKKQIEVINKRAEEIAKDNNESFAIITMRAVGELPAIIELAAPLLMMGGILLAYKGRPESSELERGKRVAEQLGMRPESIDRMTLSDGETQRTLVTYKKIEQSKVTLPRRPGMARKKPLY